MKPVPLAIMSVGTAIALGGPGLTIGRYWYFRSMGSPVRLRPNPRSPS